jgi:hypothetical protein
MADPSIAPSFYDDGQGGLVAPGASPMPSGVSSTPTQASGAPMMPGATPMPGAAASTTPPMGPEATGGKLPAPIVAKPPASGTPANTNGPMSSQALYQAIRAKYPYAPPAVINQVMQSYSAKMDARSDMQQKLAEANEKESDRHQEAMDRTEAMRDHYQDMADNKAMQTRLQNQAMQLAQQGKAASAKDKQNLAIVSGANRRATDTTNELNKFIQVNKGIPDDPGDPPKSTAGQLWNPSYSKNKALYDQYQKLNIAADTAQKNADSLYQRFYGGGSVDDNTKPASGSSAPAPSSDTVMVTKDGQTYSLPASQLQDALSQGYKKVE